MPYRIVKLKFKERL